MVRSLRKERRLGVLTRFTEVEIDPQALATSRTSFAGAGSR
jgi:hypothetical protein